MGKRKTTEQFIEEAIAVHGDKYDYSEVEYVKSNEKVQVKCIEHGNFSIQPNKHLQNRGCPECYQKRTGLTVEKFIERSKLKHGGKYDYSKINFVKSNENVTIVCPIHGEFRQLPHNHMKGNDCQKCGFDKISALKKMSGSEFVEISNAVHDNFYDYSKLDYVSAHKKVEIICPIHGEFLQNANNHLSGAGCNKCGVISASKKITKTKEQFVADAEKVHGDLWNYDLVEYINCNQHVDIVCPKHGIYSQTPSHHLSGQRCPTCTESNGERDVRMALESRKINIDTQKTFSDCRDRGMLKFDFYLPDMNILIEFDGIQHFEPVEKFGGASNFEIVRKRDMIKNSYTIENNIPLLRIKYDQIDNVSELVGEFLESPQIFNSEKYYSKS